MKPFTNLYRMTYRDTAFQGWRVSITRQKKTFQHYFSDKDYGSSQAALEAAMRVRDAVLEALEQYPNRVEEIFRDLRPHTRHADFLPFGLTPAVRRELDESEEPKILSFRITSVLYHLVNRTAMEQGLSMSSVLRLALYAYICQCQQERNLRRFITQLEEKAKMYGFPCFAEFMRGHEKSASDSEE